MKELQELWIIDFSCTEPEYHLCSQGIGISTDMVNESVRLLKETNEHLSILKVLVWGVGLRCVDVQAIVYCSTNHSPSFAVLLIHHISIIIAENEISLMVYHEQHPKTSANNLTKVHFWARGIYPAALVQQVFDGLIRR